MFGRTLRVALPSVLAGSLVGTMALAAPSKGSGQSAGKTAVKSANTSKQPRAELSRELDFSGSSVSGRYHSAGEALAQVEDDKTLNRLIGFRRDFRDRLAVERERLKRSAKKSEKQQ